MVDINDLQMLEEFSGVIDEVAEGSDQEFFAPPAPPSDGPHTVTLALGRDGIKLARQRNQGESKETATGPIYLNVHLEMRPTEDSGETGFVLFDRVTSIKLPNAGTSRLRAILAKAGVPAPSSCTLPELKAHVEGALAGKPVVKAITAWRGSVKMHGKYYDLMRKQSDFPRDAQGKPQAQCWIRVTQAPSGDQKPQWTFCGSDEPDAIEVNAQATPSRYENA